MNVGHKAVFMCRVCARAVVEEKMPGVLGGVFLHYAGEGAEAGAPFCTHKRIKNTSYRQIWLYISFYT